MIRFTFEKIPGCGIENRLEENRGGWSFVKRLLYLSRCMLCCMSFIILQGAFHLLAHTDSFISPPVGVFMIVHPVKAQQ